MCGTLRFSCDIYVEHIFGIYQTQLLRYRKFNNSIAQVAFESIQKATSFAALQNNISIVTDLPDLPLIFDSSLPHAITPQYIPAPSNATWRPISSYTTLTHQLKALSPPNYLMTLTFKLNLWLPTHIQKILAQYLFLLIPPINYSSSTQLDNASHAYSDGLSCYVVRSSDPVMYHSPIAYFVNTIIVIFHNVPHAFLISTSFVIFYEYNIRYKYFKILKKCSLHNNT